MLIIILEKSAIKLPATVISCPRSYYGMLAADQTKTDRGMKPSDSERQQYFIMGLFRGKNR